VLLAEADAPTPYFAADLAERTGLIVSNEAHGPSAGAQRLATKRIAIPMFNKVESLNAAVAGSVILFEAARQRRLAEEQKAASEQFAPADESSESSQQTAE
jgi:TrmH family RNA methyltransferase